MSHSRVQYTCFIYYIFPLTFSIHSLVPFLFVLKAAHVAFNRWNVDKSVYDVALELVPQLSTSRAQDDEKWKEVGTALAYTYWHVKDRHKLMGTQVDENPKRSLEYSFMTWSRKNHAFDSVSTMMLMFISLNHSVYSKQLTHTFLFLFFTLLGYNIKRIMHAFHCRHSISF